MGRPSKYSPELRERAVRLVFDHAGDHPSQCVTIRSVAEKIACPVEVLRRWVRQAEPDAGQRPGLTTSEREELKRLQRENLRVKARERDLTQGVRVFAQAELDRRAKCWSPSSISGWNVQFYATGIGPSDLRSDRARGRFY
jgi:transposase-like protein